MTTLGGECGSDEDCQTTSTFRMLEMLGEKEIVDTSPKKNTMSTQNGSSLLSPHIQQWLLPCSPISERS